jgi:hypothetical protein
MLRFSSPAMMASLVEILATGPAAAGQTELAVQHGMTLQEESMDGSRFDTLTRMVSAGATRRKLMQAAVVPLAGALGAASLFAFGDTSAKKKHKKKKKCKKSGAACTANKQCCTSGNICDVPTNASNSDHKCCGASGAKCGGVNDDGDALPPFCCIGEAGVNSFICSQNDPGNPNVPGTCQPAPPED